MRHHSVRFLSLFIPAFCIGCGGSPSAPVPQQHKTQSETPAAPSDTTATNQSTAAIQSVTPVAAQSETTWPDPPPGLEFLHTVPELRGISLKISENDFQQLAADRKLNIRADHSRAGRSSYFLSTPSGEHVVVMFKDGSCSGIQRLQPTPAAKN